MSSYRLSLGRRTGKGRFFRSIISAGGLGARGLEKNKYVWNDQLGGLVFADMKPEDNEDWVPNEDLRIIEEHKKHPGPHHAPEVISMEEISPEFGHMFYKPLLYPVHSFIESQPEPHHLHKPNKPRRSVTNTIIVGRKSGPVMDAPEEGGLPKKAASVPHAVNHNHLEKTVSDQIHNEANHKGMTTFETDNYNLHNFMAHVGTEVTEPLAEVKYPEAIKKLPEPLKQEKLTPIHGTISEPAVEYKYENYNPNKVPLVQVLPSKMKVKIMESSQKKSAATGEKSEGKDSEMSKGKTVSFSAETESSPAPVDNDDFIEPEKGNKHSLKKSVSWGDWTLLEFMQAHDDWVNPAELQHSDSEPNIGVQNLSRCPNKSILRDEPKK